MNKKIFINS